jgi:hypothetical protein
VVLVKKEALMEPLLHGLLKLFVARIVKKQVLCIFFGAKAFVLEHTYNLPNTRHKTGVHCGKERNEKNGCCSARVGTKLQRDS